MVRSNDLFRTSKSYTLMYGIFGKITVPKGVKVKPNYKDGEPDFQLDHQDVGWLDKSYPAYKNILRHVIEKFSLFIPEEYVEVYYPLKNDMKESQ